MIFHPPLRETINGSSLNIHNKGIRFGLYAHLNYFRSDKGDCDLGSFGSVHIIFGKNIGLWNPSK